MQNKKIQKQSTFRSHHKLNNKSELILGEKSLINERMFDSDANRISEISYVNDEIEQENYYRYENNLCVEEKTIHTLDNLSEITFYTYYDSKLIEQQIKKYEYGNEITNYKYEGQNLISKEVCDENGTIESSEKFYYENDIMIRYENMVENELVLKREIQLENGIPKEEKQWSKENDRTLTIKYTQWVKNLDPSYTVYNTDGKVLERVVRNYNSDNLIIEEIAETTNYGYSKLKTVYEYNEQKLLVKSETTNANGDVVSRTENLYELEHLIESIHFQVSSIDNSVSHYTDFYEYEFFE